MRTGAARIDRGRTADGKPDFSGIWQANNEAHWDLQAHEARPGAVMQQGVYPYEYARVPAAPVLALGAAGGVPGSLGVVEGDGTIPVQAGGGEDQEGERRELDRSRSGAEMLSAGHPAGDVHALPVPDRPEHEQDPHGVRVHEHRRAPSTSTKSRDRPTCTYMGHSVGRWEGDTLVVDVTEFNGKNWFDRAGNFHSDALRLVERFTPITPDAIHYEVTIEDPNVFTRPWKISMPLYRRLEPNMQLHRIPLHRVRRRIPVRRPAQEAAGHALGRRDDDRRHHAQGSRGRQALRVVRR